MKNLNRIVLALLGCLTLPVVAMAQRNNGAGACGCLAGMVIVYLLVLGGVIAIVITIDVLIFRWIKRDAPARGMTNGESLKWLGLLNWLGAVIYLIIRSNATPPQGGGGFPPQGGGGGFPPQGNYPPR
jgi:uncharacterized membrane protein YhaH (DUF805 family)